MAERKGDPQKEKVGTTGPAPEGEAEVAEDAKQAAAERGEAPAEGGAEGGAAPRAEAEGAEDKPTRAPRRRKKAGEAEPAEAEAAAEEAATEGEPEEAEPAEEKPSRKPARRRGAAETTAAKPKTPARRSGDGTVIVRAQAKYVRTAPRKARLVIDHIRGKTVDDARAILMHTPRGASADVLKLLNSAVANAENNHELLADELRIHQAYVDEGPTLKRFRPRARGRATRIRKRTSHMTITLTPKD